eukprot:TRINITY_DN4795_c0_g1_i4.p1 TRINITY_DN4795_c0_g1~~TRINITY_DN4795_c0_g1_i4.p1  ORF type:complete len:328 (+),score=47.79 TRINITY_DN4795_c0_g1_i4:83-985(+)
MAETIAVSACTATGCFVSALAGVQLLSGWRGAQGCRDRTSRRSLTIGHEASDSNSSCSEDGEVGRAMPALRNPPPKAEAMEAGWQGFSMEEARQLADLGHNEAIKKTPQQVLADLQKGNMRFWTGAATRPERSAFERRALISKQFPSVAVLGCADSRVPTEIVFDVGLGDMFVIRVAGNCLDTASLASLQYAIHHLKVKVVIVMGHEGCGAVKAAGLPQSDICKEPQALGRLLNNLKGGLDHKRLEHIHDARAYDREELHDDSSSASSTTTTGRPCQLVYRFLHWFVHGPNSRWFSGKQQ